MMEESSASILTLRESPRAEIQLSSIRREALGRLGKMSVTRASCSVRT
jgi:hypothetical protein